jgi:hypothetical protein
VLNGLTQFVRQPGLQMVDVADNHENPQYKTTFHFYLLYEFALPYQPFLDLRERMFIGKGVNLLLIHAGNYAAVMHNLSSRAYRACANLLIKP